MQDLKVMMCEELLEEITSRLKSTEELEIEEFLVNDIYTDEIGCNFSHNVAYHLVYLKDIVYEVKQIIDEDKPSIADLIHSVLLEVSQNIGEDTLVAIHD